LCKEATCDGALKAYKTKDDLDRHKYDCHKYNLDKYEIQQINNKLFSGFDKN